jgi:hypothetical protein
MSSDLAEAALRYAASGLAVFPCEPEGKRPLARLVPHGHLDATTDTETVRRWWTEEPNANVSVILNPDLIAVDADTYKPDCGWSEFIEGKILPATWTERGRGLHLIYKAPRGRSFPNHIARHVEVLRRIVVAPSVFRDEYGALHRYRRMGDTPAAPAPDWLLDAKPFYEGDGGGRLDWTTDPTSGLVVDGREAFLTHLIWTTYQQGVDDLETLAAMSVERFRREADLSRRGRVRSPEAEARRKAASILRQRPPRLSVPDGAPDPWIEAVPAEEARDRLHEAVDGFFRRARNHERNFQLAAIATPGLGKSEEVLTALRQFIKEMRSGEGPGSGDFDDWNRVVRVWYVAPTVRLAEALAERYGPDALVIRGRTHGLGKDDRPPLCARAEVVAEAMKSGVQNIATAFCQDKDGHTCPFRDGCPYWTQFDGAKAAEVIFLAHEYLTTTISREVLPRPDVVIIDENPTGALIAKSRRFKPEEARQSAGGALTVVDTVLAALAEDRDPRQALRDMRYFWEPEESADDDDVPGKPGMPWNKVGLGKIAATIDHAAQLHLHPGLDDSRVKHRLKGLRPSHAANLLRRVAAEWTTGRPLRGVHYDPNARVKGENGEVVSTPMIYLQHRRQIRVPRDVPVLLLDGTAEGDLLRAVWPEIEVVNIEAERRMRLAQVVGRSMAKSSLNEDAAHAILDFIVTLPKPGVIVGQKDWVESIKLPEGWSAEHFAALRGLDEHRDAKSIVVVGRSLMKAVEAERDARALFYDRDVPLDLGHGYAKRSIGLRGVRMAVADWRHPDPLVDKIRAAAAEREIEQAVDRLRLVWGNERRVILVGETPTRLPVSNVGRYADMVAPPLLRAFRRVGLLPLRAAWLADRFPDLWNDAKAAENAIARASAHAQVRVWRFRLVGQRGPRPTALWAMPYATYEEIEAFLERELGAVEFLAPEEGELYPHFPNIIH